MEEVLVPGPSEVSEISDPAQTAKLSEELESRPAIVDTSTPVNGVDGLIDEWGQGSFPASDPPGRVPPSLESGNDR